MVAFLFIAYRAKHLEVIQIRLAALAPRNDMVALHFRQFAMMLTDGANSALPFICGTLHCIAECTEIEVSFLTSEQIWVNAFLARYLIVRHKGVTFVPQFGRGVVVVMTFIIEFSPINGFHFLAVRSVVIDEKVLHPRDYTGKVIA